MSLFSNVSKLEARPWACAIKPNDQTTHGEDTPLNTRIVTKAGIQNNAKHMKIRKKYTANSLLRPLGGNNFCFTTISYNTYSAYEYGIAQYNGMKNSQKKTVLAVSYSIDRQSQPLRRPILVGNQSKSSSRTGDNDGSNATANAINERLYTCVLVGGKYR